MMLMNSITKRAFLATIIAAVSLFIFFSWSRKQPNTEGFWNELASKCTEAYTPEMCACTMQKYQERFKGKEQQFLYEVANTPLLNDTYAECEKELGKPKAN